MRFTFLSAVAGTCLALRPEVSRSQVSSKIARIGTMVSKISGSADGLAALKAASNQMTQILAETGGPADDHISDADASLLRQVIGLVEDTIYVSMDSSHQADVAALDQAVAEAAACNADIKARQAPDGDLGRLYQQTQDDQAELDRLQAEVDAATQANNTKWAEFDSHMQMIAEAPLCPDFPARNQAALDVYFEGSEYSVWYTAQQGAYDAVRAEFKAADAALSAAIQAYNMGKAIRDTQYCDWQTELRAACAAFDACFLGKTNAFNDLVPRVTKDMNNRIEVKKAGDTLVHQIKFLLGEVASQETPPIDTARYEITFPSLPEKGVCDLTPLDDDKWVPVVTCEAEQMQQMDQMDQM